MKTVQESSSFTEGSVPKAGLDSTLDIYKDKRNQNLMSEHSKKWDADGKGYLSETERLAKELDKAGKGYLDMKEAVELTSTVRKLRFQNKRIRKLLHFLIFVVVAMAAATITTTILYIQKTKELEVDSDGNLAAAGGGATVTVNAQGYTLVTYPPSSGDPNKICASFVELAKTYIKIENGMDARMVVSNNYTESITPMSTGIAEISDGAITFGDMVFREDPDCALNPEGSDDRRRLSSSEAHRSLKEHIRELREGRPHVHGRLLKDTGGSGDLCPED